MPSLFPSYNALSAVFGGKAIPDNPTTEQEKRQPSAGSAGLSGSLRSLRSQHDAPAGRYQVWSVTEDAERKASDLSKAAAKEYQKASAVAQAKVGGIELYSGKYCELAGLVWFDG
jgi:solute carrier family 25 phosphate transporter 3